MEATVSIADEEVQTEVVAVKTKGSFGNLLLREEEVGTFREDFLRHQRV